MEAIVNRLSYDTDTAVLLADDNYWDGNNWQRRGRNAFLYKSPGSRYFRHNTTIWEGEQEAIAPLSKAEAQDLFEELREKRVSWEAAFDEVVEKA